MFLLFSLFEIFFNYSLIRSCLVCTLFCLSMHVFNLKKLVFFKKKKSDLPLPPGPAGLPLLGYLPFLKREAHISFTELSKTYGPIYQLKLGSTRVVVITSAKYVREAFRQQVRDRPVWLECWTHQKFCRSIAGVQRPTVERGDQDIERIR